VLFALLSGAGLRIGEALGLKVADISEDGRVLFIRRSVWHGVEQKPKTSNAIREVDIAEPLAKLLREYTAGKTGYIFSTRKGRLLGYRNVYRALNTTGKKIGKKIGLHAFRRFRTETLRRARVPEDLTRLWLGHSKASLTDFYAQGLYKDEP
jgi:integrase